MKNNGSKQYSISKARFLKTVLLPAVPNYGESSPLFPPTLVGTAASVCVSVAVLEELTDYAIDLPLLLEPELRAMVEEARCDEYLKEMRTFLSDNRGLDAEKKSDKKVASVFRKSNAHFANTQDKTLLGFCMKSQV